MPDLERQDAGNEFRFSKQAFGRVQELMKRRAGIVLAPEKRSLVYGRLARRLRELGLSDFDAYLELVDDDASPEAERFLNALTTNVTEFFREPHHFSYLTQSVLAPMQSPRFRRIRVWSAGCSSGEEPYTIAMTLLEAGVDPALWDVKILATDIDTSVLDVARRGVYPEARIEKLDARRCQRFFLRGRGPSAGQVMVKPELKGLISFRRLNLQEPWPVRGPFDVIFCRNVVIYFAPRSREELVGRFANLLTPGGHLFLGHSESLVGGTSSLLVPCGRTIYKRRGGGD